MKWRQQLARLRHRHRLYLARFPTLARIASFLAVGATGFVIDVGVYLGLQGIGVEHRLARFVSFWPAVTWTWRLNRDITFIDRPGTAPVTQWARFVAGCLTGLAVNVGTYTVLTTFVVFFDRYRLLALVCGVVLGSLVNYLAASLYAYRGTSRPLT
ncbi:MAG: GtrA family protein [Gemmatimonadota bacterium]|nr:GtrA family protein [Gemmatimonadota bacterium]